MSQNYETFGKYILFEKVAMGGMAEVYLGRNSGAGGIGKFLAIKRILPQYSENTEFIDMFKDEAKIAVNLSHSNIVSIYEFGVEKNQFFLVMDYVEGRNLRQILNKMKKSGVSFSIEQVLYIVKEIAAGLDHAHRCLDTNTGKPLNIIHRDMSPQNVMVSFEGEVKIVDFGIAKAETQIETTRVGTLKGKFGYMSPEQAEGLPVDLRTDVFSLGIVLWELLANDRLFVANNEVNTLRKIRDCQIPSLRKINPSIPQELERIVSKALAKDRNLRYQTAAAFHRELSRFLNRQYPDFSPHDFSVFIKTLFAGEILESRKKIVEYAKVVIKAPPVTPEGTQTTTSSDKTILTQSRTLTDHTTESSMDFSNREHMSDLIPSQHQADVAAAAQAPTRVAPPSETPKRSAAKDSIDTRALKVDHSHGTGTFTHYRDGVPSGSSIHTHAGTRTHGFFRRRSFHISPSTAALGGLIGFIVVLLSMTVYYLNNPKALPSVNSAFNRALYAIGLVKEEQLASQEPELPLARTRYDVAVKSSPSGASILVNGKIEPEVTPATIRLEEGQIIHLKVELREGFLPYEEEFVVDGPRIINAILKEDLRGYLDIIVNGNGTISLNGRPVARRGPLHRVPVPADTDIIVSVYDPVTRATAQQRVRVGKGALKRVILSPRILGGSRSDATQKQ